MLSRRLSILSILMAGLAYAVTRLLSSESLLLILWFRWNGGWIHSSLQLTHQPACGRGLMTRNSLAANETILKIPKRLILSPSNDYNDYGDDWTLLERLVIQVWQQVGCDSTKHSLHRPYWHYLLNQPTPPLLFTFRDTELRELHDEPLTQLAQTTLQRVHALHRRVEHKTSCTSPTTTALFKHVYALVTSHALWLDSVPYLVPVADFINHKVGVVVGDSNRTFADHHRWHKEDDGRLHVTTDRHLEASQLVVENYANLDNSLYVHYYGFIPRNNPHHCVVLTSLQLPQLLPQLVQRLLQLDPKWMSDGYLCVKDNFVLHEMHPYLSLWTLQWSNHSLPDCHNEESGLPRPFLDATKAAIQHAAQQVLDHLPPINELPSDARPQRIVAYQFRQENVKLLQRLLSIPSIN